MERNDEKEGKGKHNKYTQANICLQKQHKICQNKSSTHVIIYTYILNVIFVFETRTK